MRHINLVVVALFFCSGSLWAQPAKEVWDLYGKQDLEQVIAVGEAALKTNPEDVQLNLAVGRALADRKQFGEAIPFLEKAIRVNSSELASVKAWGLGYLGLCYYTTDQYDKAKESLRACVTLNATKNATQYAGKRIEAFQLSSFYDPWEVMETTHFRFHFQNKSKIDAEDFIVQREKAYEKINQFFGGKPYKKIDFYVWDDQEQGKQVLGKDVGFASPDVCIINSLANQTPGHEITHVLLVYGLAPKQRTRLINEGTAVFFDQTNRDRLMVAKKVYQKTPVRILDLWNSPDKYPDELFYSVGGAFIEFLDKNGSANQLKQLLKNQTVEEARAVYGNLDELVRKFEDSLLK